MSHSQFTIRIEFGTLFPRRSSSAPHFLIQFLHSILIQAYLVSVSCFASNSVCMAFLCACMYSKSEPRLQSCLYHVWQRLCSRIGIELPPTFIDRLAAPMATSMSSSSSSDADLLVCLCIACMFIACVCMFSYCMHLRFFM